MLGFIQYYQYNKKLILENFLTKKPRTHITVQINTSVGVYNFTHFILIILFLPFPF
jgi:hypothetical protein